MLQLDHDVFFLVFRLANAFYLDPALPDKQLLENIAQHHLDVLNRFLNLSELRSHRLAGLPVLEDLLQTRLELLKARYDINQTKKGLRERKMLSGHRTPDWAINEFSKKLLEVNDKLATNRNSIDAQVREVLKSFHGSSESDSVTYH